ncbi:DNA/RNA non-specific endonuclease [Actinosynnema sp. NPDC023794]
MINPAEIPQIPGDMDALVGHATAITRAGTDFANTGQQVNSTWQGLAGVYRAPESGQLLAATAPVQAIAASVGEDVRAVGAALNTYAAEVRQIKAQLATLRAQAIAFVDSVQGDEDWREDEGKVDRHNKLRDDISVQVAAFFEAQRRCANTINALYGGTQYRAENGDGRADAGEYGYTADQLKAAKELPWGTAEEHDRGFLGDVGAFFSGVGESFMTMLGDLGALIGRDPTTGEWSWGTAGNAWKGVGTFALAVGVYIAPGGAMLDQTFGIPGFDRGAMGNLLLNAGKSLIAYDQWGQDNARAAGTATFNIVSAVVGTKGAGAALRGTGTAVQAVRGGAVATRVSAGLIRAGQFLDNLPTVGELATRAAQRFNIQIPTIGPVLAIAGDAPVGGHRFDVEMPGPGRGTGTVDLPPVDSPNVHDRPRVPDSIEGSFTRDPDTTPTDTRTPNDANTGGDRVTGSLDPNGTGRGDGTPADTSRTAPEPSEPVRIGRDDPDAPPKTRPFGREADGSLSRLEPNTAYEVTDRAGRDRGTFITDENGRIKEVHTTAGQKGDWRPDARQPLPNVTYHITGHHGSEYHFTTDANGQTSRAEGDLVLSGSDDHRRSPDQAPVGHEGRDEYREHNRETIERFQDEHGRPPEHHEAVLYEDVGWDGGHLFGTQFDGPGEYINMVPMLESLNRHQGGSHFVSNYRALEDKFVSILRSSDPPPKLSVSVAVDYPPGGKAPNKITVEYRVDGMQPKTLIYRNVPPRLR